MDTELIKIILAFMVLINPFSALSLFLNITNGYQSKDRQKVAQIACITIFLTIAFFTLLGESLLKVLGISVGSFQVAGGILVFLIAINMMNGSGNPVKPNADEVEVSSSLTAFAVVPLAIPMMIGPGAFLRSSFIAVKSKACLPSARFWRQDFLSACFVMCRSWRQDGLADFWAKQG